MRRALRDDPIEFVQAVSSIMSVVDPVVVRRSARLASGDSGAPPVDLPGLAESFVGIDVAETTAALYVMAALTTDEFTATKIRRELPRRHQPVPDQVRDIAELRVASAWLAHDRLGDGESVFLELGWPSGARASVSIYIDHAMGTRVKDAFVVDGPVEPLLDRYRQMMAAEPGDPGELGPIDLRRCPRHHRVRALGDFPRRR